MTTTRQGLGTNLATRLSAGGTIDDVLAGYPTLTRACLAYSARMLKHHFNVEAVA